MQTPKVFSVSKEYTFDHMSYSGFLHNEIGVLDYLKHGYLSSSLYAKLCNPNYIQKLYQEKNPGYMAYLAEFYTRFHDFDVIVMNPGVDLVHPEFLISHFPNALKCLHFIDDPHMTYSYCFPFSWAFDCATYITPSYSEEYTMPEILSNAGFKHKKWFPHCITNNLPPRYSVEELSHQLWQREKKAIYVGNFYTSKVKRLIKIKSELGDTLDIFGRHPFGGLPFPLMSTLTGYPSLYRVQELQESRREEFYSSYAIGLNMHLSDPARETGNARLYELAYRGVAQVVDSSECSAVRNIFTPEKEILLYENLRECIAQVKRLQNDDKFRVSLALNAYIRATKEYSYETVLTETCDWFKTLLAHKSNNT